MSEKTKQCITRFNEITGITPVSAKANKGSMSGYITFTLDAENQTVREFFEKFYTVERDLDKPRPEQVNRKLNGLPVEYIGSKDRRGYFTIEVAYFELERTSVKP